MDWSLFLSAFISSTLMPGGSEALLVWKLHQGGEAWPLVLTATLGNVLGSLVTYGMGRLGNAALHRRWLGMDERRVARAEAWFARYGQPALLLAWLPVVGDPLCLVAGVLRSPLGWFVPLVAAGKLGRYAFLAWAVMQAMPATAAG
jgi:membrane protein YqaA with SNARE-associated domain